MILLMAGASFSYGQFSFGVSPGLGLNSAYLGYKLGNKFVPFVGFQYLNANLKVEESDQWYNWESDQIITDVETIKLTGNLYVPNVGLKYFVKQHNKLQAYLSLCVSKPILSGKLNSDYAEDVEAFEDDIKGISMWGGEFGFGVEYFFDENFSLGGEFGIRYLHLKYIDSYEYYDYYPPFSDEEIVLKNETDYRFNMSPTYSKISLNYYF